MALAHRVKSMPFQHIYRRCLSSTSSLNNNTEHYRFAVVGGGAGGLSIASHLSRKYPNQVAVIEPSDVSCYFLVLLFCVLTYYFIVSYTLGCAIYHTIYWSNCFIYV